jgi:hypothetical protein
MLSAGMRARLDVLLLHTKSVFHTVCLLKTTAKAFPSAL